MDPKAQVRQAIVNAIRRQDVQTEIASPKEDDSFARPAPTELQFDERDYLELHQDVAEFVRNGLITAEEHWRGQGSKEGRQGRKLSAQWMTEVEAAHAGAENATALIGREPPVPATLRGAVSAAVLKVVRPFFAWYTHGLREYVERVQTRETLIIRMLRSLARESQISEAVQSDLKQEIGSVGTRVATIRSQVQETGTSVQLLKTAQARQRDVIDQQSLRLGELEAAQIQLQSSVLERDQAGSAEKRAEIDAAVARLTGAVDRLEGLLRSGLAAEHRAWVDAAEQTSGRLNALHAAAEENRKRVESLTAKIAALTASVQDISYEKLAADAGQRIDELLADAADKLRSELTERVEQQDKRLWEVSGVVHSTRHQVVANDARIAMLVRELRRMAGNGTPAPDVSSLPPTGFETVYTAFEDVFRGTRQEIREKQRIYIPVLAEAGAGTAEMPILDVGCGRGEWMELLREHDMTARGIDGNAEMVERSREVGLDVAQADAIEYLRGLPDNSHGAITTFHMVEHLPFDDVLVLISESLRVLKPNGLFLLETPNPNNLFVGARNFYADPTHRNPLPCGLMRFVVESRGFADVVIREVNPLPDSLKLPDSSHPCVKFINDNFFGPQDYAIIARKY